MSAIEKVEPQRWPMRTGMVVLLAAAVLVPRSEWLAAVAQSVLAAGTGRSQSLPGAAEIAGREPTFEEELERLHPGRSAAGASCGSGACGNGCCGCCSGGTTRGRGSGSGSGSGSGAADAGSATMQCRPGQSGGMCGAGGRP